MPLVTGLVFLPSELQIRDFFLVISLDKRLISCDFSRPSVQLQCFGGQELQEALVH